MIDDEELRNLFKTASEEHLQKIEAGLLHLEKYPNDSAPFEELLREAHSLKGDAGMLEVRDVETLTHQMEHILGSIKRGETALTPAICDRLWLGLDSIRKLVNEAITGDASGVNTFQVLAQLMGAEPTPVANQSQPNNEEATPHPEIENGARQEESSSEELISQLPTPNTQLLTPDSQHSTPDTPLLTPDTQLLSANSLPPSPNTPPATSNSALNGYHIETIRVETRNLDALMTQAGELTVTKIRIAHRLAEIEELLTLWEELTRLRGLRTLAPSAEKEKTTGEKQEVNFFSYTQQALRAARSGTVGLVLPRSETLTAASTQHVQEQLGVVLNQLRNSIYEDSARLDAIASDLEEGIRTLRLLPLSTIFNLFPRMVRDLGKSEAKEVELVIEGAETKADKRILEEMKDPLMHLLRNCVDHGIETPAEREQMGKPRVAKIRLKASQTATNIMIEVSDDGRGLDVQKIKQTAYERGICREEELAVMTSAQIQSLIFAPGFSTRKFVTEVSGRGVGLDVVRTNVEQLKGTIQVESQLGKGCTFRIHLGATLATAPVLIVEVDGRPYGLPVEYVQTTKAVTPDEIFAIEGRETIVLEGQAVSVVRLADLLGLQSSSGQFQSSNSQRPCTILQVGEERLGVFVDALLEEQDVILKPQSKLLKRVRNVAGATILSTGEVCMILNPSDLIKSLSRRGASVSIAPARVSENVKRKPAILLAEDSIAIRTQEKRILESAGYEVVTAVDGLDGFNKLKTRSFDAVVSDVQMPNLDGLALTVMIRQYKEYNELPIVLVTSLASDEDKRRGAEAGANAYITKGTFNQEVLLETLRRLVYLHP